MDASIPGYDVTERLEEFYAASLLAGVRQSDRQPFLIKTLHAAYPRAADIARLSHERAMLERLDGVRGVARLADHVVCPNGAPALVLAGEGRLLAQALHGERRRTWTPLSVIDFAIALFKAIRAVHEHDMVHQSIAPQNILIGSQPGDVALMNFEIASELSRERQGTAVSKRLEGALPYISPEQTGRLNRDLDYRSDYYSAGMVIYELLAGAPAFQAAHALEWVHAHISRMPPPPAGTGAEVPDVLGRIVLKLIAKSPDDRYQSSFGVLADLERCRRELAETGRIEDFRIAQKDLSERFHVPQDLYGRETEIAQLTGLFERVADGSTEICFVSGYSGIGKSALVGEINRPIVRTGGYFVQGKFDQFHRNRPYEAIAAAFSGLVHQLLAEPKDRLDFWRDTILSALGANARVLTELVPDLTRIVGTVPPVADLPPAEAQNRLQIVFQNFVRLLARSDQPLVIFLDDLQWADTPTLHLLQKLATARDVQHLLIIGAYRSNEVDPQHLLTLTRDEIAQTREVHEVPLPPLDRHSVEQIVAGALRTDAGTVRPLAEFVYEKTEGNPFFVNELLRGLEEDRLIRLDRDAGAWAWDMDEMATARISDSVVDFVVTTLEKLPEDTQEALQLAACIGSVFDLRTLSVVHERTMRETAAALMAALKRNMVVPLDQGYKYLGSAAEGEPTINPRFKFQHDRIQQAAYALIDKDRRAAVHLSIGRLIQALPETERAGRLIEVVRHLDEGRALIADPAERTQLAQLNLDAAREAHAASAYEAALAYVEVGRELLGSAAWPEHYDMAKALSAGYVQNAYLTGRYDEAEAETDFSLGQVKTALEKAEILSTRTRQYSTMGRPDESILAAIEGLRLLGVDISLEPPEDVLAAEIAQIEINLAGREIADLADAPAMTDREVEVAVRLLMEIFPAAFLSNAGNLFQLLVVKSVNLAMKHGNSTETAFAYAAYGMLLCGALNDPWTGFQYGRLALAMNDSLDDIGLKSRIIYVYAMFIHHWSNHWTSMTKWFKRGIETGYQSGDLLYLAYNAQDCIIWDPALDLPTASAEQRKYLEIVRDTGYQDSLDSGTLFLQMQLNFLGETDGPFSLSDDSFDEQACYDGMQARKFMTGLANYHIYKTEVHSFYGDWQGAARHIEAQDKLMASVMSLPQLVRYRFVAFVALAELIPEMSPIDRSETLGRLRRDHVQMMRWAANCPENFRHLELGMAGQLAWRSGDAADALRQLAQAIQTANEHGWLRDEAMLHEITARKLDQLGLTAGAQAHLAAAHARYYRWGATRKLAQMEEAAPALRAGLAVPGPDGVRHHDTDSAGSIAQETLDLDSVMKAARAISGEIMLESLWTKVMEILLENAGAERGVMVVRRDGQLVVEVAGSAENGIAPLPDATRIDNRETNALAPASIVNYALRTREPVVLDNAAETRRFRQDPYVLRQKTRSVLCVPLVRQDQFEGAVYLENNLTEGAFTEDRVQVVELLAAQVAISIDNARLYVNLERKVAERTAELSKKTAALERLSNQLAKYLSPQVYRSIFDSQTEVKLASERKRLTVFFLDLVGFTATADRLASEELTQVLNHYLTEMSAIALKHGATIDKFMGDAIMVFFGDPETRGPKEDALACVRMAIEMRGRIAELRQVWHEWGIEQPLECRMGIHTGYCTVGNFGSESRLDYTIIGGTVNLASRLESLAAAGEILISYETYAQVRQHVLCDEKGHIDVRGISHPVATYQVVDLYEALADGDRTIQSDLPNLKLDVDVAKMSAEERRRAAALLRDAAERLAGGVEAGADPAAGTSADTETEVPAQRPPSAISAE